MWLNSIVVLPYHLLSGAEITLRLAIKAVAGGRMVVQAAPFPTYDENPFDRLIRHGHLLRAVQLKDLWRDPQNRFS